MSDNIYNQSVVSGRRSQDNHPGHSAPLITHERCLSSDNVDCDASGGSIMNNNGIPGPDNKLVVYSPPSQQQISESPASSSTNLQNIGLPEADELELFAKICKKRKTLEAEKVALKEQIISLERAAGEQREKYDTQLATERAQAQEDRKHYQTWREKVEQQNDTLVLKSQLIESKDREINELKASLKSISDKSEQQTLQIEEKCDQLNKADENLNAKVEELKKIRIEFGEMERKLGGEISGLKEKVQKVDKENANLSSEIGALKQLSECEKVEFKRNVRELDESVKMKQREIDTITNERDALESECKTLSEEMTTKAGQISALESERNELNEQVGKLTGDLESKTQLVKNMVEEEKKYRKESTMDRLLKQDEMSEMATTTLTAWKQEQQQRRSSKRKSSPAIPKTIAEEEVPAASIVATADTTISSSGATKSKQKRRAK